MGVGVEAARGSHGAGDATIDWRCLAEPQPDQYDSRIVVDMARRRGWARREPGVGPSLFDGRVALRNDSPAGALFPPECVPAQLDHPNIARGSELVRLWPVVFSQFQVLIDSVCVFTYQPGADDGPVPVASAAPRPGAVAASVDHVVAFAESLVHEMAHHKLWALGVELESAERLIRNPPAQTFPSPIRLDRLRPMPAVVHAEYSYTYVAALDIEIARNTGASVVDRVTAAQALARHLPRLELGLEIIRDHADLDEAGAAFMVGWQRWLDRVLADGHRILDACGIRPETFAHPLLAGEARTHCAPRPSRLAGVREYRLGAELLLYVPERAAAHALNPAAAAIWQLCDGTRTEEEIGEELARCLGRPGRELGADVRQGLARFRELGLLHAE
ncbi:MAG: PqqD family peptide modification chaperone [Candidatus Rokuibacteriota bacterium]